jgi:putative ABC transport system permease protein
MMTGQILSGVDPLVAVRYQIVVMCMIFGSSGLGAAGYLLAMRPGAPGEDAPRKAHLDRGSQGG